MSERPPPVIDMLPTMSAGEQKCLWDRLEAASTYVEFGCGYSTAMALASGAGQVHAVESDPGWIKRLQIREDVISGERSGRLHFHHVDIGPIKALGAPADMLTGPYWRHYYTDI